MGVIDELKSQAREVEREIEMKLDDLEKINLRLDPESLEVSFDKPPEVILQTRIETLLAQLKQISEQMVKVAESPIERSVCTNYNQAYTEAGKRFRVVKNAIESKRWQQKLIGQQIFSDDSSKVEVLLKEEKHLDETLEIGKNILAAANDVRVSLAYQAKKIDNTSDKIVRFAEMVPGISYLMKRISARQRFNAIVTALAISICLCIIIYKIS